jgi:hypothetical protein
MPRTAANNEKVWSSQDIADLEVCASIGDSAAEIAAFLSCTEREVRAKAAELGIRIADAGHHR